MTKTLLVADDALIIREMIKDTALEGGWTIVGEATDGQQAYDLFCELQPDVMTLDMVMPEYDGMHGLRRVMNDFPRCEGRGRERLGPKKCVNRCF